MVYVTFLGSLLLGPPLLSRLPLWTFWMWEVPCAVGGPLEWPLWGCRLIHGGMTCCLPDGP